MIEKFGLLLRREGDLEVKKRICEVIFGVCRNNLGIKRIRAFIRTLRYDYYWDEVWDKIKGEFNFYIYKGGWGNMDGAEEKR